jgi:hypothetical protein
MSTRKAENLSDLSVIGVDIGKDLFHLVGSDAKKRLLRSTDPLACLQIFARRAGQPHAA